MVQLSDEQDHGVNLCCDMEHEIVSVTGAAGTGKTTILEQVFGKLLTRPSYRPVLCAPTGRAAKRISELTGYPAMTIHRLLEFPMPDDHEEMRIVPIGGKSEDIPKSKKGRRLTSDGPRRHK